MERLFSRRRFLKSAIALTAAANFAGADAAEDAPKGSRVIVTGGHPGDPEYGCGGTIARLTSAGSDVLLLYLNEGEPELQSPRLPKGTRVAEAEKACEILRARPAFAGQIDGNAIIDKSHYEHFRGIVAAERPDAVFTHWPIDNHADHRAIFMLAYDAWVRLGKKFALFYYEVSNGEDTVQFAPTQYVGISAVEGKKRAACYAHASQSPDKFYALQDSVARWRGMESGQGRAEAFIHHAQSPAFALPL
ncbi:MAG TPA: PIG-L family deacetylase [Verrucomicrobiae bacterium]|nr:PIG-L family deacetylase [Verrucomicrobiae bacterium]